MFESIKKVFFQKALNDMLGNQHRLRHPYSVKNAKTVGILFDASQEKQRNEVLSVVKQLEGLGKKVRLLGFLKGANPVRTTAFPTFTKKETSWKGIPTGSACSDFTHEKFNLLICFNPEKLPELEWIAADSAAAMKTGIAVSVPNDYDFQLDLPAGKPIHQFLEGLASYLDKIILNQHEPAATL